MSDCYAYIRVSTAKQGEMGVSLQEQRASIERYAEQNRLAIIEWFEERETAAKRGRRQRTWEEGQMTSRLRPGAAGELLPEAIREMWRAEFTAAPLEHARRMIEAFAGSGAEQAPEDRQLEATLRDLAYARDYASHLEAYEAANSLRRGDCYFLVIAGRIANELGALLVSAGLAVDRAHPWKENGLRESFLPALPAESRQTLAHLLDLLHNESIEERSSRRAGRPLAAVDGSPSPLAAMLGSLGAELSFLSVRLKDLFLPAAAKLSSSVERLAIAATGGAKEGQHA